MASFIITKDHICDGDLDNAKFGNMKALEEGKAVHKFRLFDDDNEMYYEGLSTNSSSFDPLDWAMEHDGCTDIKYLENGKWESL